MCFKYQISVKILPCELMPLCCSALEGEASDSDDKEDCILVFSEFGSTGALISRYGDRSILQLKDYKRKYK